MVLTLDNQAMVRISFFFFCLVFCFVLLSFSIVELLLHILSKHWLANLVLRREFMCTKPALHRLSYIPSRA